MITFVLLSTAGLMALAVVGGTLASIQVVRVFIPEEYPKRGVSTPKVVEFTFNWTILGVSLLLAAYASTHIHLP